MFDTLTMPDRTEHPSTTEALFPCAPHKANQEIFPLRFTVFIYVGIGNP